MRNLLLSRPAIIYWIFFSSVINLAASSYGDSDFSEEAGVSERRRVALEVATAYRQVHTQCIMHAFVESAKAKVKERLEKVVDQVCQKVYTIGTNPRETNPCESLPPEEIPNSASMADLIEGMLQQINAFELSDMGTDPAEETLRHFEKAMAGHLKKWLDCALPSPPSQAAPCYTVWNATNLQKITIYDFKNALLEIIFGPSTSGQSADTIAFFGSSNAEALKRHCINQWNNQYVKQAKQRIKRRLTMDRLFVGHSLAIHNFRPSPNYTAALFTNFIELANAHIDKFIIPSDIPSPPDVLDKSFENSGQLLDSAMASYLAAWIDCVLPPPALFSISLFFSKNRWHSDIPATPQSF